ncbi:hypothetical protein PG987_009247 [Apiospora arundinis]
MCNPNEELPSYCSMEPDWDAVYCYKIEQAYKRALEIVKSAWRPYKGSGKTIDAAYRSWILAPTHDDAKVNLQLREKTEAEVLIDLASPMHKRMLVRRLKSRAKVAAIEFQICARLTEDPNEVQRERSKVAAFCREHDDVQFSFERMLKDPLRYIRVMGIPGHETLWMEILSRLPPLPNNQFREREATWFNFPWDHWYESWY